MNFNKRILLFLSIACISTQNNAFNDLTPTDLAKLSAWTIATLSTGRYFLRYPERRLSCAPFERILEGRWDNVFNDIFNIENAKNYMDLLSGQRGKTYSQKFDGQSGAKIAITDPNQTNIKPFGIPSFCEKNISKICKLLATSGALYALLYGKLEATAKNLLLTIFDPYKHIPDKLYPATNNDK